MAEREQRKAQRTEDEVVEEQPEAQTVDRDTAARIDDLLDEIDAVLEENAEEFVKNYVQKGGE